MEKDEIGHQLLLRWMEATKILHSARNKVRLAEEQLAKVEEEEMRAAQLSLERPTALYDVFVHLRKLRKFDVEEAKAHEILATVQYDRIVMAFDEHINPPVQTHTTTTTTEPSLSVSEVEECQT